MPRDIEINIPPGLEKFIGHLKNLPIIPALIVLITIYTSFYQVPSNSLAIVYRFGKILGSTHENPNSGTTIKPGLHFKLPFGIDTVESVAVDQQMKQDFGYSSPDPATNPNQASQDPKGERSMVTGDSNLADVSWVIQFKINDPILYLTRVKEPQKTLRDVSESVMRSVVGDRTVDEVLTVGRQEIQSQALTAMQELVTRYELGIEINQVQLLDVNPPEAVQDSFNAVNKAKQARESLINDAEANYNRDVPKASGEAKQLISEAEGYAKERVNRAEGDVARFNHLFNEYKNAPAVTKQRIYIETMAKIYPRFGRKIILEKGTAPPLSLLPLSDWPTGTTTPESSPTAPPSN